MKSLRNSPPVSLAASLSRIMELQATGRSKNRLAACATHRYSAIISCFVGICLGCVAMNSSIRAAEPKPRARDLGIPFEGTPGPLNAITDIKGVEVGHTTLIRGQGKLVVGKGPVRTGVTAIPRFPNRSRVFQVRKVNGAGAAIVTTR